MIIGKTNIILVAIILILSYAVARNLYAVEEVSNVESISEVENVSEVESISDVENVSDVESASETESAPRGEPIPPIDTEASCVTASCHQGMGKKKFVHGVGVDGRHCIKCHKVVQKGEHTFSLPSRAVELCAQCHSGQYIAPTDVTGKPPEIISGLDLFEEGEKSQFHAPFAEGKCTACHSAHESDYYLHLVRNYPQGFYATFKPDTYSLCIGCHKDFEKVLIEPRTFDLTEFRNGNLNLHFRHVNKRKGRTCKACHHHHGSENPKLIKDDFLFGTRRLAIGYKKNETGGSCAPTCHVAVKYDRYNPFEVRMRTTPVPGEDATEYELRESRERDLRKIKEKNEEKKEESGEENEDKQ